jgi:surface antigen
LHCRSINFQEEDGMTDFLGLARSARSKMAAKAARISRQFTKTVHSMPTKVATTMVISGLLLSSLSVIRPLPAHAIDTGGYPDAEAPCVANNNNIKQGTGTWCAGYQWGYYIYNGQGQITGNTQDSSRGFGYRNCTDWAAWRVKQLTTVQVPYGPALGHAQNWDENAAELDYNVDTTPEVGDVAVWEIPPGQSYGHVAVVESVNSDGTVNVSEYNKGTDGIYGTRPSVSAPHYIDFNGVGTGATGDSAGGTGGGSTTLSKPASVVFNGALNVFIRGNDGQIYQQYWNGTNWTGYASIGGGIASDPDVIVHNGALSVFARGNDGQIYNKYNNGSGWTGWASMGNTTMKGIPRVIQYGSEIDLFALGTDGHPYKNTWQSTSGWGGWSSMGDYMDSSPKPIVNGSSLSVIMRGTNNQTYVNTWNGSSWSGFGSLGGTTSGNPDAILYGGFINVLTNTPSKHIYTNTWNGTSWGGWADHGGNLEGDVEVMQYGNDMQFFARGTNQHIYHRYWSSSSQTWGGWSDIGGGSLVGDPIAIQYGSELDVFVLGSDGKTYKNTFQPSSGWGGFTALP